MIHHVPGSGMCQFLSTFSQAISRQYATQLVDLNAFEWSLDLREVSNLDPILVSYLNQTWQLEAPEHVFKSHPVVGILSE